MISAKKESGWAGICWTYRESTWAGQAVVYVDAAVVVRFNVVLLIDLILFFLLLLFSLPGSCLLFLCLLFHLLCDIPSSHLLRRASAKDLEPKSVLLLLTVPVGRAAEL